MVATVLRLFSHKSRLVVAEPERRKLDRQPSPAGPLGAYSRRQLFANAAIAASRVGS